MTGLLLVTAAVVAVAAAVRGTWSPCGLSMVSAINPFSEHSRGNRYAATCAWFVAGAVLGGALLGSAAAALAVLVAALPVPATGLAVAGALAAVVAVAVDAGSFGTVLPLHPRQVDERWLASYRRWVYASGFGLQIGVGVATYVMTAGTLLLAVLAALSGAPAAAVGIGVLFGLVRGLAVLLTAGARSPAGLRRLHRGLEAAEPWSLRGAVAVQAVVAVVLSVAAGGVAAGLAAGATVLLLVAAGSARTRRPAVLRRRLRSSAVPG